MGSVPTFLTRLLQRLDVGRGRAFLPLRHVERHLLAVFQRFEPRTLDRAVMGKEILAAVIRRDESEPLRVVEPLHGTCRHVVSIPEIAAIARGYPSLASGTMIKGRNRLPLGRPLFAVLEGTSIHLLEILQARM